LENELAPYYEEALRMPGGAKNPKLFDGYWAQESNSKLGMDDKFDATTVAIYFREENVTKKGSVFCMGPERRSSTTHILGGATMGENSTEGVVDKTIKFFDTRTFILSIAP
jgi:cholesterol oxidase